MMERTNLASVIIACAFVLTGCAGMTGANPAAGGRVAAPNGAVAPHAPPAIDGIAGRFAGTVTDSVLGKGTAVFEVSQEIGGSAGGSMQLKFGTAKVPTYVAFDASSTKDVTGTGIALIGGQAPCTLAIAGRFSPKTLMLTGTYKAFNNCFPGEKGTFAAKEACYYTVAKPTAFDLRPRNVPKAC
jgi:hypothetical protein